MKIFKNFMNKNIGIKLPGSITIHHDGIGLIIGKGMEIGKNCDIYQCVTSGEKYCSKKGVPKVGNDVMIDLFVTVYGDMIISNNIIIDSYRKVDMDVPSGKTIFGCPYKFS